MSGIFDAGLERNAANYAPLTPVSFVERSAEIFGDLTAVIHGARRYDWAATRDRAARLAAALRALGVGRGTTVSVMLSNTPEMLEAHYAIPALGAVIHPLNTRLDGRLLAWQMNHCETSVLITDREFSPVMTEALRILRDEHGRTPIVIDVCDSEYTGPGERLGEHEYEALHRRPRPARPARRTGGRVGRDRRQLHLGHHRRPQGRRHPPPRRLSQRGVQRRHLDDAELRRLSLDAADVPLQRLVLPVDDGDARRHPCVPPQGRGRRDPRRDPRAQGRPLLRRADRPHLLINAPPELREGIDHRVRGMVAAAAPSAAMIEGMAKIGIDVTHVYGLTEVYGPAAVCVKRPSWAEEPLAEQVRLNGRQGVRYVLEDGMTVLDPDTMAATPADGATMGEIMFRGNITMKGYLKNPKATEAAFKGGWFHTGDLAVMEPDRYMKIRDRSKDIIISGGENISSLEVEDALYRHPAVAVCAVVARPDEKWGETPLAFVELKPGASASGDELIAHCRGMLAGYKVPREVRFEAIPKTSTGKIQKYQLRALAKSASAIA